MDLEKTLYRPRTASEVATVTGASNEALQTWLKRKLPVGVNDIEGGGSQGRHRRFSFGNVIEIALAKTMIDQAKVPAKFAFLAAGKFAHTSGGGAIMDLPYREMSMPFHHSHGDTILGISVADGKSSEELHKPNQNYDTFGRLSRSLPSQCLVTINVSRVFGDVCSRMGLGDRDVLDTIYPNGGAL
ncbi:MAG: hypothetical protein AAGI09_05505 [Pseudomonadota bacterium]